MTAQQIERRSAGTLEATDPAEGRRVSGYAALFNSDSRDLGWGFVERIMPGAFDDALADDERCVLALLNHYEGRGVLAKHRAGGGTLTLEVDERGLKYSFDAPNTALGDELLEGIRRGDISESSFAFTVEEEIWEQKGDRYLRTIHKVGRLFDVSPVYDPAYRGTSVTARSQAEVRAMLEGGAGSIEGSESSENSEISEKTLGDLPEKPNIYQVLRAQYN